jgi:hypothetical protein
MPRAETTKIIIRTGKFTTICPIKIAVPTPIVLFDF